MQRKPLPKPPKDNVQVKEYIDAVKRGQKNYYVSVSKDGWSVRQASTTRANGRFTTKNEAVSFAKKSAATEADVIVHGRDGKISVIPAKATPTTKR